MKARIPLLLACVLGLGLTQAAETGGRFSQALTVAERTEIGVSRFSSDQVAVLDALVRRDVAGRLNPKAEGTAQNFSGKLTVDERRNAGLGLLTSAEVTRLDQLVDQHAAAVLARTLLAPLPPPRLRPINPTETKSERKIHGTYSLSFGWGSGGYSERTGSVMLHLDDPDGRYAISVGYSESHIKGGPVFDYYRDDSLYRNSLPDGSPPR